MSQTLIEGSSKVYYKDRPWTKDNPIVAEDLYVYPEDLGDFESIRCVVTCKKLGKIIKETGQVEALSTFIKEWNISIAKKESRILFKRNSRAPKNMLSGAIKVKAMVNKIGSSPAGKF